MPVLYPASADRIARLRTGVTIVQMSRALGHSISLLSLVERGQLDRPAIRKKMKAFVAAHRRAS